jgi:hypothetical protein
MKMRTILIIIGAVVLAAGIAFYFFISQPQADSAKKGISGNNPFGFAGPYSPPDDFNKIKALGVKYIRTSVTWDKIETSQGNFVFGQINENSQYDILKTKYNLEPIIRFKTGQGWPTRCDTANIKCSSNLKTCPQESADCPPKDLSAWSKKGYSPLLYDFVSKTFEYLFSHGKPINYVVVGNEVNDLGFWHGTADDFLKTRTTIYQAIQDFNAAHHQNVKVIDNGIAGMVWGAAMVRESYCSGNQKKVAWAKDFTAKYAKRWTDLSAQELLGKIDCQNPGRDYQILKATFQKDPNLKKPSFDYMSYHFYEPWDTQEEVINWLKAEMKKNGYERPIMNTEGGYADRLRLYEPPAVAQDVANDLVKLHVVAFANEVKLWLWLPFTDRYTEEHYGPQWKGLIKPDQTELPAYTSYKIMVSKLRGFASIRKINLGKDVYAFQANFQTSRPIYILWSNSSTIVNLSSKIKGFVKITRVDGATSRAKSSRLRVSESPIFVEK